jgi:hypothetical protein
MRLVVASALAVAVALAAGAGVMAQDKPKAQIPQPGVPEVVSIEGEYVRAAYNNEGYVILGYRLAGASVGEPWMLLDVGGTLRDGVSNQTLQRGAWSLSTPDGKTIPLPSNEDFQKANLMALEKRASVIKDSINYFPSNASGACRIGYFAELAQRARSYDQAEFSSHRACLGRLYFPVEGGIKYGQHYLNVKFQNSTIRVPFRIFTKEEEKLAKKNYKALKQQVEEAFAPKKK